MLTLSVCVFIGIIHLTNAEAILDATPLTINSVKGKQVVLPCSVKNLGFSAVIWFSPTGAPIAKDTYLYTQDSRFRIEQPYMSDFNIAIENVNESDQGIYICMVMGGIAEKRVTLVIQSPPKLDEQRSSPNVIMVKEGETLTLQCHATGKPEPVIRWYRTVEAEFNKVTKEDLNTSGSTLTVNNIQREATGSYECTASNDLPPAVSREIIVTVHFKPAIYPQNDKFTQTPGKTVIFECVAEGYPLPAVKWQRRGKTIDRSENSTKYRHDMYEDKETIVYSLRINELNDEDFGTYTCEADNIYGYASHDYVIEKTGIPKIQSSSTLIRKMKSENAELECRVTGFPRNVVWLKNGEKLTTNRHNNIEEYKEDDVYVSSLTIPTLSSSDFSVYVCQAENEYGSTELEIIIEQSGIDISGPTEAKVGQEIALVCNATTNSVGNDSISWLKNGLPLKTTSRITTSRDISVNDKRIYSKLYIKDMTIGDQGTYTCKTKYLLLKSHSLSIVELPEDFVKIDKEASSKTPIVVKENSGQITLTCKVEAYPRKMVFWFQYLGMTDGMKDYKEISSGEEKLILGSDRSVTGIYQCRASNGKQAEETLDINIEIQYPVKVSVSYSRVQITIGNPLILECNITGNPITSNFWVSPKGLNATFDHTQDLEYHNNYVITAMTIMTMKFEDFGMYKCVGGNHLGNDSANVVVIPIFPTTTSTTTTTTTTTTTVPTTRAKTTTKKSIVTTTLKPQTAAPNVVTTTQKKHHNMEWKTEPTSKPMPTATPIETDKEQVKQDNNSSSMYTSSYILLALTAILTFRLRFAS